MWADLASVCGDCGQFLDSNFLNGLPIAPYPVCVCVALLATVVPSNRDIKGCSQFCVQLAPPGPCTAFSILHQQLLSHSILIVQCWKLQVFPTLVPSGRSAGFQAQGACIIYHSLIRFLFLISCPHTAGCRLAGVLLLDPRLLKWLVAVYRAKRSLSQLHDGSNPFLYRGRAAGVVLFH